MARPRSPLILRAPATEELLAYPEFRKRAVDALIYIMEAGNEERTEKAQEREVEVENAGSPHE
jgi:hypothetical protein